MEAQPRHTRRPTGWWLLAWLTWLLSTACAHGPAPETAAPEVAGTTAGAPAPAPGPAYRLKKVYRYVNSQSPIEEEEYLYSGDLLVRVNWKRHQRFGMQANTTRVITYSPDGRRITIDFPFMTAPASTVLEVAGGKVTSAVRTRTMYSTARATFTYGYSGPRLIRYEVRSEGRLGELFEIAYGPDGRLASATGQRFDKKYVKKYVWDGGVLQKIEDYQVRGLLGPQLTSYDELRHDASGRLVALTPIFMVDGRPRTHVWYTFEYDDHGNLAEFLDHSDAGTQRVRYEYEPGVGNAALLESLPDVQLTFMPPHRVAP